MTETAVQEPKFSTPSKAGRTPSQLRQSAERYARMVSRSPSLLCKVADNLGLDDQQLGFLARMFKAETQNALREKDFEPGFLDRCMARALVKCQAGK